MNSRTFFNYVAQMRQQQKRYFKTRSQSALVESRRLESIVDAEIERVNKILNPPQEENSLF